MMQTEKKWARADDNNGHKIGESRPGFFGGLNHYDDKGHKRGHSNPGFLGGFNHYDD